VAREKQQKPSERGTRATAPTAPVLRFAALAEGELFARRYRIRRSIGSGGHGEVFEAFDEVSRARVALKVLYPGPSGSQAQRVRRELELVRSIHHPAVVRVWDIGEFDGLLFVVSELHSGETLKDVLRRERRLAPAEAERILRGILEALAVAHERGIIHRDVKPANVFLAREPSDPDSPPRVVLLDFGLARREGSSGLTSSGRFLGTPEYCAPEQIRGETDLGPGCDLYACGVTLWEMLIGAPPFEADSDVGTLTAHLEQPLPNPRKALGRARPALRALAVRLLEKHPADRPPTAAAALEQLETGAWKARWSLLWTRVRSATSKGKLVMAAAGLLAAAVALAHGLYPAGCEALPDGQVRWTTCWGFELTRDPLPGGVAVAGLTSGSGGISRGTWLVARSPDGADFEQGEPIAYRLSTPLSAPEPVRAGGPSLLARQTLYEDLDGPFSAWKLIDLGPHRRSGEARLAIIAHQKPNYASVVILLGEDEGGWVARYVHPGHVVHLRPHRAAGDAPLQLIGTAFNNHLAHRIALFSIPARRVAQGQAPPFRSGAASVGLFDSAHWYRLLPRASHPSQVEIELESSPPRILVTGAKPSAFDPKTGTPLEAEARGGLSPRGWREAYDRTWTVLRRSAGLSRAGDRVGAARMLEELAEGLPALAGLRAAVWTLAARERLRVAEAAADPPRDVYERVLEDTRKALEEGVELPATDLLQAEMLVRLGRVNEVGAVLDRRATNPRQHADHIFPWYLIHRLAGMPRPMASVWPPWAEDDSGGAIDRWEAVVRSLEAHRSGRHEAVPALLARIDPGDPPWALHRYLEARSHLDRSAPDGSAARSALDAAEEVASEGTILPLVTARLAALTFRPEAKIGQEDVERAVAEVRRFERLARTDLSSLMMLDFAVADAVRVARAAGRRELAASLEARLVGSCFVAGGTCGRTSP
jgi:serine/threonine-protein kinase